MQTPTTPHPEPERLGAFGLGRLTEEESRQVELHLADCNECRRHVEELPGDALVSLLQASAQKTSWNATPASLTAEVNAPAKAESLPPLYRRLASILTGKDEAPPASAVQQPAPMPARTPGMTLPRELEGHARYDVLAPLGAGGMGTVYRAQHRLMGRLVALKIVNPLLVTKPGAVERFEREVKAAAQLVHPNIVTAFDAEKIGDMHVLVMEYVEGETLAETLLGRREMPVATACDYLRQTAVGLAHALERGMVHRDIKPQNLMLTSKGVIKILDFGLARFVSEQAQSDGSTEHGALMGSPDYMAPEQGQDAHSADARADIYGMGCTLYHLLAGQVPFPESSLLARLEAHRDRQALPLNHVRTDVPVELAKVVAKMMAKDPAERYQTPGEVAEALRPFTYTQPAAPKAQGQPSLGSGAPFYRKPIFALAVAAALLLVGISYWAAQIILRVETPQGTLIVTTNDPDVQVSVRSGGKEVALFFPKQKKEILLKVGEYTIELVGGKDGLKLSTKNFRIENGKGQTVTVDFEPILAKKDPRKAEEKVKVDPTLPALPSVDELLKTREVLTVDKDGSARFKTIQAALDALQPGQVILVKDKGPYRELLRKELPANVALISKVGTRIEIPRYENYDKAPEKDKFWCKGPQLTVTNGFHLSGFELTGPMARPADLFGGMMVHLEVAGDVVLENCSFQGPQYLTGLTLTGTGQGNKSARVLVQDNLANQGLEFHPFSGSLTIERNWISTAHAALFLNHNSGNLVVRHNILQADGGIFYHFRTKEEKLGTAPLDLHIHNNVIEVSNSPILFAPLAKDNYTLPRSGRIVNNIIRSRAGAGILLSPDIFDPLKEILAIGPNAYQDEPKGLGTMKPWPKGGRDQVLAKHFLSVDPKDASYLRIAVDGSLASGGAGGDLPAHFGAFPPGPAPKDGDWFTRLLEKHKQVTTPASVKDLLAKAQEASDQQQNERAISLYTDIMRLEPKNFEALVLRGVHHIRAGNPNLGLQDLTEAVKREPDDLWARANRSNAFLNTGRFEECIADADFVLSRRKEGNEGHLRVIAADNRGAAYARKGRFERALANWELVTQLDPKNIENYSKRGQLHERLGNTEFAKADLERVRKERPNVKELPRDLMDIVAQPAPLAEWLQDRSVLTVSQDGKAMFKTIGAAIDALKPGQAIKVLDKGPYRERLDKDLPENVALFSEVGTRIEWDDWRKLDARPENPMKFNYVGMALRCPRNLRLAGLEMVGGKAAPDAGFTPVLHVTADGDVVVESCRVRFADAAPGRVDFHSWSKHNGNLWLRENHFERHVFPLVHGSSVIMERNYIHDPNGEAMHIFPTVPPRELVLRHNVFQGVYGLRLGLAGMKPEPEQWANTPVLIANNYFETSSHSIWLNPGDEAKKGWYPHKVRIHNNIFHSKDHCGIILTVKGLNEVKDSWQVSHNSYQDEPGGLGVWAAFPRHAKDLIVGTPFVSLQSGNADYLRIAAKGSLATSGSGGHLPSYIGPLPPGPAPKDGDWFTRLRDAAK